LLFSTTLIIATFMPSQVIPFSPISIFLLLQVTSTNATLLMT